MSKLSIVIAEYVLRGRGENVAFTNWLIIVVVVWQVTAAGSLLESLKE